MALRDIQSLVIEGDSQPYDGTQLAAHFLRARFGVVGDGIVAFRGPCEVRGSALVDLEDRASGLFIVAREMVHFLAEIFQADLETMILLQRLLAGIVADVVRSSSAVARSLGVERRGDDVFVGSGKLSVRIATVSPVSGLIHFGVNLDPAGAPVETASLRELGVDAGSFAHRVVEAFAAEVSGVGRAACKVRPAGEYGDSE